VDIKIGAAAALTSILGRQATAQEKVVNWSDFGVDVGGAATARGGSGWRIITCGASHREDSDA
jgi:hypothetical protein